MEEKTREDEQSARPSVKEAKALLEWANRHLMTLEISARRLEDFCDGVLFCLPYCADAFISHLQRELLDSRTN